MNRCRMLSCVLGVLVASAAVAQIAPPPPPPPDPTPAFTAPPPVARTAPPPPTERPKPAPRWKWAPIAQITEDGKLLPLAEPSSYAALRNNPTIDTTTAGKIGPVITQRRARLAKDVINNLDMIHKLESGILDKINIDDTATLIEIVGILEVISGGKPVKDELRDAEALTIVQANVHDQIRNEYWDMVKGQLQKQYPGEDEAAQKEWGNAFTKALFSDRLSEPLGVYEELLLSAAAHPADVIKAAELTGEKATVFAMGAGAIQADWPRTQKLDIARKLIGQLEFEQQQALLRATLELYPPAQMTFKAVEPLPEETPEGDTPAGEEGGAGDGG